MEKGAEVTGSADMEIIQANCRAYDQLDQREERNDKKEQLAGKVIDRIKHLKKAVKERVRKQIEHQHSLVQRHHANDETVDPESMMHPTELFMMVGQAAMVLDSLEQQEEEIRYFKMGMAKRIKCPYCEHKGESNLEESTPLYAYILCFITYLLLGIYSIVIWPCILGILRDQKHRCPKCHNEIKEDSIFSSLDDNIVSFNLGTFGVLLTRRTLLRLLVVIVCLGLATLTWDFLIEGPSWYLDGREPDPSVTWIDFQRECGQQSDKQLVNRNFQKKYKNVVVQWEGKVLRVDGDHHDDDEDDALMIDSKKHYQTHYSAEIMVRMEPPLRGLFYSSDYDLLLVLDRTHFERNQEALDVLRVGSDIKFTGFMRNLGKATDFQTFYANRRRQDQKKQKDQNEETLMPWFQVFDIEVVHVDDELPTEGYNRKSHHHLHKDMRYSVEEAQTQKDSNK